jgi:hypothetical protein
MSHVETIDEEDNYYSNFTIPEKKFGKKLEG